MSTNLITVPASPMPQSWREAIAEARKKGAPEMAVQLIATAATRGAIEGNGWLPEHVNAALGILKDKPRSETRCRRLRGLSGRLNAADRQRKKEQRLAEIAARPKQGEFSFEAPPPPPGKRRAAGHTLTT